jgi:GTPase
MVLLEDDNTATIKAAYGFTAEVFIMAHPSTMRPGKHEYMAHSFALRAVVRVDSVVAEHDGTLNADEPEEEGRVGELARKTRGVVHFRFLMGPEWVSVGERVLITDSSGTRVVGRVVGVDEWSSPQPEYPLESEEEDKMEQVVAKVEELKI